MNRFDGLREFCKGYHGKRLAYTFEVIADRAQELLERLEKEDEL